ncbi:MAG: ABC transporter ATP-binding protein [Candidatus Eisenbacteria bacterium]|nr:ABC transporter ATP-binding protein [Candidatus Eisenbacteria bacterium]
MNLNAGPEVIAKRGDGHGSLALHAIGLCKSYRTPGGSLEVLRGIDLEVPRGMLLAIVGASGSGKSTLLNLLGTLDRPDSGTLELAGQALEGLDENARCRLRLARLGFVFQFHHLLPEFTAEENVMMPLLLAGQSHATAQARAREVLAVLGLEGRREHVPSELSGGEAQRVAVGRALAPEPALLLADEPSGNLDAASAVQLHSLLKALAHERHQTVVVVTHDMRLAGTADRVLRLEDGRLLPA